MSKSDCTSYETKNDAAGAINSRNAVTKVQANKTFESARRSVTPDEICKRPNSASRHQR